MIRGLILVFTLGCSQLFSAPNPAYVYCIQNGGTMETREDSAGNQDGVCMFNQNGAKSECGQWRFFRGECSVGQCARWSVESNSCQIPVQ